MIRKISRPLLILFAFTLLTGFLKAEERPPVDLLFSSAPPEESVFFGKILEADSEFVEKAKIQYLIDRIRHSEYPFIRNGVPHSGSRAATHLSWKLQRKGGRVKTAQQFINDIAAKSSMSGEEYLVKIEGNVLYAVRDILQNELQYLENRLQHQTPPALHTP